MHENYHVKVWRQVETNGSRKQSEGQQVTGRESGLEQSQKGEQRSFKSRGNLKATEIQLRILRGLI